MDKSQKLLLPTENATVPSHKMQKIELKEKVLQKAIDMETGNTENFATDWNVDKYRYDYESDEQWELKCRFMTEHKNKFPEDKLVSLAQSFINVELLGCVYATETMQLIGELSKDVAKEYREKRTNRLKPILETASNAATQYTNRNRCEYDDEDDDNSF